ncbi:MAG TPA: hypothetical protein PKA64_18380 [Myxococcota bacterium]|nr:hypothetical protein [Myxococcota bacterium]
MLPVTLLTAAWAASPCPDFATSLQRAESAIASSDFTTAIEQEMAAEDALACGMLVTNDRLRARFMLVIAVRLDYHGDRLGSDDALYAAWTAWPSVPTDSLPLELRERFVDLSSLEPKEGAFRLFPVPDRNAILYVDGSPVSVEKLLDNAESDPVMRTTAGLHVVQVAASIDDTTAIAGRMLDLADGSSPELFNVYERVRLGGSRAGGDLPTGLSHDGPKGGCASGKK